MRQPIVGLGIVLLGLFMWITAASGNTLTVTVPLAAVRQGPSWTYRALDTLARGETFTILKTHDGWHQIRLDDGREVWIAGSIVRVEPSDGGLGTPAKTGNPPRSSPRQREAFTLLQRAIALYSGTAGRFDEGRARHLFEQAAQSGHPLAVMWLARGYFSGRVGFRVRRGKAPFYSGCESRPATVAPAGSSRSG